MSSDSISGKLADTAKQLLRRREHTDGDIATVPISEERYWPVTKWAQWYGLLPRGDRRDRPCNPIIHAVRSSGAPLVITIVCS